MRPSEDKYDTTYSEINLKSKIELTTNQAEILNLILPKRYKLEFSEQKSFRTRKLQKDLSEPLNLPEKRPIREKEPEYLVGQSEGYKKCYQILQSLKVHHLKSIFLYSNSSEETSEENLNLNTIETRFINKEYLSSYHLAKDIRTMINQKFLLNSRNSIIFVQIFEFAKYFERLFKGHEKLVFSENIIQDLNKVIEKMASGIKEYQSKSPTIKNFKDKKLTSIEKKQILQSIKKLDPKYLNGVMKIVKGPNNIKGEEFEFDVEKLSEKVLKELDKYVKQCLLVKPSKRKTIVEDRKNERVSEQKIVDPEASESSESSSSSSESEDEMPGAPLYTDLWDKDLAEFSNGISIDFDKY